MPPLLERGVVASRGRRFRAAWVARCRTAGARVARAGGHDDEARARREGGSGLPLPGHGGSGRVGAAARVRRASVRARVRAETSARSTQHGCSGARQVVESCNGSDSARICRFGRARPRPRRQRFSICSPGSSSRSDPRTRSPPRWTNAERTVVSGSTWRWFRVAVGRTAYSAEWSGSSMTEPDRWSSSRAIVWSSTASYAAASTRAGGSSVHGPSSRGGERLGCAESGTKTLRHAARLGRTTEQRPAARSVVESGITGGIRVAGSDRAEPRHLRGSP